MGYDGRVQHLIIGAGFAGLCAAIKLQEDGERDFLVVEKGPDVGGTWRDNTYPGATCDIPSQLYSFSFATNPDWSSSYSPQPEIQAYIQKVAKRSGTLDRFVFDTTLVDATWDDDGQQWLSRLVGPDGERTVSSSTLIVGAGGLSEPKLPAIEGIDTFQGQVFHSAQWNHDVDLTGKRVAVIGTGASAIQIIPELQQVVGHLDVYQRTAPWVIPRDDRTYGAFERRVLRRLPALRRLYRTGIYWAHEAYVPGFTLQPKLALPAKKMAQANIAKGIKDPELRAKVTPYFAIGCKRILRSNTYYPALAADNVELVTDPIAKVTGNAVVTADGVERSVDVLVVATGFHTTELPIARAGPRPGRRQPGRHLARRRDGGVQGHDRARVPQPVHDRRPEHRPGPHQHGLHHRVAGRLHPRRDPDHADQRLRHDPAARGRDAGVERRPPAADEAHRVDHRRLPELVPRRARQEHRPLATQHGLASGGSSRSSTSGRTTSRPAPRALRRSRHEPPRGHPRRQGRRDHRRRVRHRPGARAERRQEGRPAGALRHRRGRPRRDRRPGEERRCPRGPRPTGSTWPTGPRWRRTRPRSPSTSAG